MIGNALSPMALLLVGISLAYTRIGSNLAYGSVDLAREESRMPALVLAIAPLLGVTGLPLAVMFVIAAMPVGANVFYFTQRYGVMQQEVSASIAASTLLALATLPVAIYISHVIQPRAAQGLDETSGSETLADPVVAVEAVREAVVQTALAALPEFPAVGHQTETAPMRRAWRAEHELGAVLGGVGHEDAAT